jgi:hypothetical protein
MIRSALAATLLLCLANAPAGAADATHAPPPAPYRKVSELVKLPDFLPGIGTLYVVYVSKTTCFRPNAGGITAGSVGLSSGTIFVPLKI